MYIYVELWKAKDTWMKLDERERSAYVAEIGPAINALLVAGVELVGFARNDEDTPHRASYRYIAVWKMPNLDLAVELEKAVEASGFHEYFEQINARGEIIPPEEALGDMVGLG